MSRKPITEDMRLQDEWYKRAKNMKPEDFLDFANELSKRYEHDYGTVCHAMAAIGLAAMYAFNETDGARGGITGFQAQCVMWLVIQHMNYENNKCGLRLLDMDKLLYPQYEYEFCSISSDTWDAVKKEAQELLKENATVHPDVVAHWQSIASGKVPFGLKIEN